MPIEIDTGGVPDFALVGIQPSGEITPLLLGRSALQQAIASSNSQISDQGNGRYRITIDVTHNGWSGFLLLTGTGPFDSGLIAPQCRRARPELAAAIPRRRELRQLAGQHGLDPDAGSAAGLSGLASSGRP